jgi:hypothetical protein
LASILARSTWRKLLESVGIYYRILAYLCFRRVKWKVELLSLNYWNNLRWEWLYNLLYSVLFGPALRFVKQVYFAECLVQAHPESDLSSCLWRFGQIEQDSKISVYLAIFNREIRRPYKSRTLNVILVVNEKNNSRTILCSLVITLSVQVRRLRRRVITTLICLELKR